MGSPSHYVDSRAPLTPTPFLQLPLGAIEPRGWLLGQLKLQAWGITGHLDEIWPDVGPESGWLGGTGEDWERGPYYLDGLVPLAYLLRDDYLIAKARRWIEWAIGSQQPDGSFGPQHRPDWWSRMPMLKALIQHHEATGDERVLDLLARYYRHKLDNLAARPLEKWAQARGGDAIYGVYWLYNRTGDAFLLDLAEAIFRQTIDWTSIFHDFPYRERQTQFDHRIHVVNVAMAVKEPGLFYLQSGDSRHREAPRVGIESLMRYHGLVNGIFSGDEWLAGPDPSQGTETCAVVEYMFSLEVLARTLGDPDYADRLERVAFNALPACQTPDLWGHQYDQQPNQVLCSLAKRNWTANREDSNLFGLAPNFGCCTANLHQGWPKLAASLWAATPDGGLAVLAYAPSAVTARVGPGDEVRVVEETDYPFQGSIRLTVRCARPVVFPLTLRVPGWCSGATVGIADEPAASLGAGHFHTIRRTWRDGDVVTLDLPMDVRLTRWHRNSLGVERGPLVYALAVGEAWRKLRGSEPCPDWEVHPTTPWNFGLVVDPADPAASFRVESGPVGFQPFDPVNAPVRLVGRGRRIPEWQLVDNSAGPLPESPVASAEPEEEVVLVPYGCARLRVSEIPQIAGSR